MTQKRYIVEDGTDSWETDELPDEEKLADLYGDGEPETRTSYLLMSYRDTKTGEHRYVFPHWHPKPPLCYDDDHKWVESDHVFPGHGAERVYRPRCERCGAVRTATDDVRDPATGNFLPFSVIEYRGGVTRMEE